MIFMGTSRLSEKIFESLLENKYNIVGVFTKPDSKTGRNQGMTSPAVKILAQKHKIPVFQPERFDDQAVKELEKLKPDLAVVAAYGKILPKAALELPAFGCINVHVSLLPKYRGPSPIQNALLQGEKETGVTVMLMDEGIDSGDILAQKAIPIKPHDNTKILSDELAVLGAELLLETIPLWVKRKIQPKPQDHSRATLCQLIEREDGHIYWSETAEAIYNRYRALSPWPGIFSYWKNNDNLVRLKLLSIYLQKINPIEKHAEGEVFEIGDGIGVQTSRGVIIIKEIQKEGKRPMSVKDFIIGAQGFIGSILQ